MEGGTRRLSLLLASPYRLMERVAEATADLLVPAEAVAPVEQPSKAAAPSAKRQKAQSPQRAPRAPAAPTPQRRVAVKTEPAREMPFRSRRHKSGFYNESHLTALAWRGSGSAHDPIRFD